MATQTITTQRAILKHGTITGSWLPPAVTRDSENKYVVDHDLLLHRIEKVLILILPTIWATYHLFHVFLDSESSFCLSIICCVPVPDLYFFFETFRAERMAAFKNQTTKNISITDQGAARSWRWEHRNFS